MFLDRMAALSRERTRRQREKLPEATLKEACRDLPRPPSLRASLASKRDKEAGIVAEIKRRSPSRGEINSRLDIGSTLKAYEKGGALGVSVLTEPSCFGGSLGDLQAAASLTRLPLLRKDFIVDDYQLLEARAFGASVVLLIAAMLGGRDLQRLVGLAAELHLECLVEVHDEQELERALEAGAQLVGINNRDLRTLKVDLETTLRLAPLVPAGVDLIAESGYRNREQIETAWKAGVGAFLVGEVLSESADPERELLRLRGVDDVLH